ncbi:Cytochrome P450 [Lasiodiplodia theobromae]|uniref:Cytochrome P450 n=1 Tax=Lasiodiplodia theobromae TaxID=45133 RepID=UPI0015C39EBE|nr:Cytochrome P450 [Lasiodiplodia theobromae]KAF4535861.1 Cytochrome P450 [Lasiodiplodia theobromae]
MISINELSDITTHHLALVVIACVAVVLCVRSFIRALFSPLRSVPGPFLARFTRLWYLWKVWRGDFQKTNIELHRKYGPVVRITPYDYSIDDPSAVKPIYGHGTAFTKGPWYDASRNLDAVARDLFTDRDPKRHAANRRKVASLYSMSSLLRMEEAVNDCVGLVEEKFREIARSGRAIDLQWWLQCYAFDVIGAITVAKRFGFLDKGEDPFGLIRGLDGFLKYMANVGIYSEIHPILCKLTRSSANGGLAHAFAFASKNIQERVESNKKGKRPESDDFLTKVLRLHEEQPHSFGMEDVLITCSANVVAGSDTTSISLSAIMWGLIKNPEAMTKLRSEVDEKLAKGEISEPVTFAEAQKLPYLQAVIQEGLRTHPATGLPLGRVVPEGGVRIAERFFPGGTVLGINSWVAHYNKDVFGDDADLFRPERWLADKETVHKMGTYFLPLVRKFDFHLDDPYAELQLHNAWFVKQKNFMVRVTERKV